MELRKFTKDKMKSEAKTHNSNKKESIHSGHRQRLKDQFLESGIDSLSEIQQLELLLFYAIPQKDTNPISHALLNEFGSLKDVLLADVSDLLKIDGVKENTATFLHLVGNVINVTSRPNPKDIFIGSSNDAISYCTKLYNGINVEQFYVICLSKENKIKKVKLLNSGTADEINIQIRTITEFAIQNKCNRILISHNHPNGPGRMSDEDGRFTYSLICSCFLNSIDVIDHIIVGTNKTISLGDQGILQKLKKKAIESIQITNDTKLMISNSSKSYIYSNEDKCS